MKNKKTGEKEDIKKSYFFENFISIGLVKNIGNKISYEKNKRTLKINGIRRK